MNVPGIINLDCKASVAETVSRLEGLLKSKGIKVFSRIDQAQEAKAVGLAMRPMVLLIFGDPKMGVPLMLRHPSLAIDVPFKALIWETVERKVWLTYNALELLEQRHGLDGSPFAGMVVLLHAAAAMPDNAYSQDSDHHGR